MLTNIHCLFVAISFCFRCPSSLLPQDFTLKKINLPLNYQVDQLHSIPTWVQGYSIGLHILSEHIFVLLHSSSTSIFIHCRSKLQWRTARVTVGITLHTEIIFSCILLKWLLYVTWLSQYFNYIFHDTVHKALFTFKISYGFTVHAYT
jgi:hypothetical protein